MALRLSGAQCHAATSGMSASALDPCHPTVLRDQGSAASTGKLHSTSAKHLHGHPHASFRRCLPERYNFEAEWHAATHIPIQWRGNCNGAQVTAALEGWSAPWRRTLGSSRRTGHQERLCSPPQAERTPSGDLQPPSHSLVRWRSEMLSRCCCALCREEHVLPVMLHALLAMHMVPSTSERVLSLCVVG